MIGMKCFKRVLCPCCNQEMNGISDERIGCEDCGVYASVEMLEQGGSLEEAIMACEFEDGFACEWETEE